MPVRVVDGGELVQVDEHHPQQRLLAARALNCAREQLAKHCAAGQARYAVVSRQLREPFLGSPALGDVAAGASIAGEPAARIERRPAADRNRL